MTSITTQLTLDLGSGVFRRTVYLSQHRAMERYNSKDREATKARNREAQRRWCAKHPEKVKARAKATYEMTAEQREAIRLEVREIKEAMELAKGEFSQPLLLRVRREGNFSEAQVEQHRAEFYRAMGWPYKPTSEVWGNA